MMTALAIIGIITTALFAAVFFTGVAIMVVAAINEGPPYFSPYFSPYDSSGG